MAGHPVTPGGLPCCACPAIGPDAPNRLLAKRRAADVGWAPISCGWRCPQCREKGLRPKGQEAKPRGVYLKVVCVDCRAKGPEGIPSRDVKKQALSLGWGEPVHNVYRCPKCKGMKTNGWAKGSSLHINCSPQLYKALEKERDSRGLSLVSQAMRSVLMESLGLEE